MRKYFEEIIRFIDNWLTEAEGTEIQANPRHRGDKTWVHWTNHKGCYVVSVDNSLSTKEENTADQVTFCFAGNACFTINEEDMEPNGKWHGLIAPLIEGLAHGDVPHYLLSITPGNKVFDEANMEVMRQVRDDQDFDVNE